MMRPLLSTIVIAVFILWILPLGVFIAPSKEKSFCGGQRAICLCSHVSKSKDGSVAKTIAKANASTQKESSGFLSSQYDASLASRAGCSLQTRRSFGRVINFYNLLVSHPVEHVPKA